MNKGNSDIYKKKADPGWAIRELVPKAVYTDREEHLKYLYKAAIKAASRRTMSTVLLGQRRMGKTEIFKRVVNRLFFEQNHRAPEAVVPVYYSFADEIIDRWEFATGYVENFLRWYAAFRLREPQILSTRLVKRNDVSELIRSRLKVTEGLSGALNFIQFLQEKDVTIPEKEAVTLPRSVSDWDESTIVMFLDEFQNTRLPQHNNSRSQSECLQIAK